MSYFYFYAPFFDTKCLKFKIKTQTRSTQKSDQRAQNANKSHFHLKNVTLKVCSWTYFLNIFLSYLLKSERILCLWKKKSRFKLIEQFHLNFSSIESSIYSNTVCFWWPKPKDIWPNIFFLQTFFVHKKSYDFSVYLVYKVFRITLLSIALKYKWMY